MQRPLAPGRALMAEALTRIATGLAKKLLLADHLGRYVDMVHEGPAGFSGGENLLAIYAYSFQIYFDFSGYSDIAIGMALLLGYRLCENFRVPYTASDITRFWRSWHISLSDWLRDHIYIPPERPFGTFRDTPRPAHPPAVSAPGKRRTTPPRMFHPVLPPAGNVRSFAIPYYCSFDSATHVQPLR